MDTIEIVAWVLSVVSVTGVVLNIYKIRACFILWIFTNGFWMCYDIYRQVYPQDALFFVYFCLAVWGTVKWRKADREEISGDLCRSSVEL